MSSDAFFATEGVTFDKSMRLLLSLHSLSQKWSACLSSRATGRTDGGARSLGTVPGTQQARSGASCNYYHSELLRRSVLPGPLPWVEAMGNRQAGGSCQSGLNAPTFLELQTCWGPPALP